MNVCEIEINFLLEFEIPIDNYKSFRLDRNRHQEGLYTRNNLSYDIWSFFPLEIYLFEIY